MKIKPEKISNRIIVSFTILIMLLVIGLLVLFNNFIRNTHLGILKNNMDEKIEFIEHVFTQNPAVAKSPGSLKQKVKDLSEILKLRITIVNTSGRVISDSEITDPKSMDNHRYRIEISSAIEGRTGESIRYSNTLKTDMLYYAKKTGNLIIRLAKPLFEIEKSLTKLRNLVLFSAVLVIISAFIIIIIISRIITWPLKETTAFAEQFADGDYSKRILNYRNDEIGSLQKSLNRMADTILEKINTLVFEQNKLNTTIDSIQDGIAVISVSRKIIILNESFSSFLEIDFSATGKPYYEAIRNSTLNSKIEDALNNGEAAYFEEELMNRKYCDVHISPVRDKKTIQGILLVIRDTTEKKKIEQIKTDLVSNMSHELKTPVAILKGYLETIKENISDEKLTTAFIARALHNADRQASIINDILKLNRLETSKEFSLEPVDLKDIIENCVSILLPKAGSKNINIKISADYIPEKLRGNRFLAEEVIFNLVDNAINYNNDSGNINIDSVMEKGKLVLSIRDSGIGIPVESLDRIFERFYRVDKSRSRATGGTGLGLSIVKHAADLMRWDIKVSSNSNGTNFSIYMQPD